MDLQTLQSLALLFAPLLVGKKLTGVEGGGRDAVVLHFGREFRLLLSWEARSPGLFLAPGPAVPPRGPCPLAEPLGARIEGAALAGLSLPISGERVVELAFSASWPRKGQGPRILLEVMGRRSNLFLLDPAGRILASARPLSPSRNRVRPLRLGGPYSPPPPPPPLPAGGTPSRRVVPLEGFPSLLEAAWSWRESHSPAASAGGETLAGLLRGLDRLRAARARELAHLRAEEERCREHARVRLKGEALLHHLKEIPLGADRVLLPHPADPETAIEVLLDPSLSPQANGNRIFDLARRLERGLAGAEGRKSRAEEALRTAEEALAALARGDEAPGRALLGEGGIRPASAQARGWAGPGRRHERDGFAILVGRGAEDNDRVTFEAAAPSDLWLHARDYPSSHVVILAGKRRVPEPVVLFAASLCAGKSGAKKDTAVEVMVAERKWVRKMKGQKPGLVTVSRSRTVLAKRKKAEEWPG